MSDLYSDYPLQAAGDIRTLILQPAPSDEEPLSCRLAVVSLGKSPEYEALSYTWGAPFEGQTLDPQHIILCEETFEVTGNLYVALKRFRTQNRPRVLWVDAVCIDQSNDTERSAQVAIMAQIYAAASRVLIWLGEDSDSHDGSITLNVLDHLATTVTTFDIVQAIVRSEDSGHRGPQHYGAVMSRLLPADLDFGDAADDMLNHMPDTTVDLSHVRLVMKIIHIFFTRRYFRRLWVVQEMYHAKGAIIHCGAHLIYWQRFQRGFDRLRKSASRLLIKGDDREGMLDVLQGTLIERLAGLFQFSKHEGFFLKCIAECNGTHCEDPRDRIFALSSMNSLDWPQPDYSASASDVFTKFSEACVAHNHAQSVLFHAARQQADPSRRERRLELEPRLSSWVLDWRHPGDIGMMFWSDWASENGPDLQASINGPGRLSCNLGVLGIVVHQAGPSCSKLALQTPSEAIEDGHRSTAESVWSSFQARCEGAFEDGDVLCRLPSAAEMALDEKDGLIVTRTACRRPSRRLHEDAIIVLRPVSPGASDHVVVPLNARAQFQHRALECLPNNREWRRFSIV